MVFDLSWTKGLMLSGFGKLKNIENMTGFGDGKFYLFQRFLFLNGWRVLERLERQNDTGWKGSNASTDKEKYNGN